MKQELKKTGKIQKWSPRTMMGKISVKKAKQLLDTEEWKIITNQAIALKEK